MSPKDNRSSKKNNDFKTNDPNLNLTLSSLIGEGATAYVYSAKLNQEKSVVVKVAKPGWDEYLEDENKHLYKIFEYFKSKSSENLVVPQVDRESARKALDGNHKDRSLIVMENVDAKSMLDALKDHENNRLEESQVLSLTVELFDFLTFLHSKNLTYPDFKIDNLRLQGDYSEGKTPHLRILDLGGLREVDDKTDSRYRRDVITAAAYLFAALTGRVLQISGGELKEDIDAAINRSEFAERFSWGTTQIFMRLLTPIVSLSIPDAEKVQKKAEKLFGYWKAVRDNPDEFITQANSSYEIAENMESANQGKEKSKKYQEALERYSIYYHFLGKPDKDDSEWLKKLESLSDGKLYLKAGQDDLKHQKYESALQNFKEGESLEGMPALFRRWRYLAGVMEGEGCPYADIEEVASLFASNRYSEVSPLLEQKFGLTTEHNQKNPINPLKWEAQVYSKWEEGIKYKNEKKYEEALASFRGAESVTQKMEPAMAEALRKETSLPNHIADCEKLLARFDQLKDYQDAFESTKQTFLSKFDSKDLDGFIRKTAYLPDAWIWAKELIICALEKSDIKKSFEAAHKLFWGIEEKNKEFRDLYSACSDLNEFERAAAENDSGRSLGALERLLRYIEEGGSASSVKSALVKTLFAVCNSTDNSFEHLNLLRIIEEFAGRKKSIFDSLGDVQQGKFSDALKKKIEEIDQKHKSQQQAELKKAEFEFKKAKTEFENGDLDGASRRIDRLPPEVRQRIDDSFLSQISVVQDFVKWKNTETPLPAGHPDRKNSLDKLNEFASRGLPKIYYEKYIGNYPFTENDFKEYPYLKKFSKPDKKSLEWKPIVVFGLLGVVIGIAAMLLVLPRNNANNNQPVSTLTPMPTLTEMPTLTPLPTLTPTPTPLPDSVYKGFGRKLELPVDPEQIWQMNFSPCGNEAPEKDKYCFSLDAPIPAGAYAVFVQNDLTLHKKSASPITFNVYLDDKDTPENPLFGMSKIQMGTRKEVAVISPLPKTWILSGAYQLEQPDKLKVQAISDDPTLMLPGDFGNVVLVRLGEKQIAEIQGIPINREGYNLVAILDETNLVKTEPIVLPALFYETVWNHGYTYLQKGTFTGSGVFPPGIYTAYYHVVKPEGYSANMSITLKSGVGTELGKKEFAISNVADWVDLVGEFTLDKPTQVLFDVQSLDKNTPVIVDAILIYAKQQQ